MSATRTYSGIPADAIEIGRVEATHGEELCQRMHIERLLTRLQCASIRDQRNHRSSERFHINLPLVLERAEEHLVHAVSRNMSLEGIGLFSSSAFEVGEIARIEIQGGDQLDSIPMADFGDLAFGEVIDLNAECIWCSPIGPAFWISGWNWLTD